MRKIGYLPLLVCAVLALMPAVPSRAQEHVVFTPHWIAQAQFAGYYVAKEKGFYQDEGLDVDIVHPSATQAPLDNLLSGKCQVISMSLCQALDITDRGIGITDILQTSMNSSTMIISRTTNDMHELNGCKMGTWINPDAMCYCMSRRENLEFEWVRSVSNVNFFIRGGIDAMTAMSYNEYYHLQQSGMELKESQIYRLADHGYNVQEDGIYMANEYYGTHKDQACRFAKASRRGWEWAAEHPEETLDIVMQYVRAEKIGTNRTLQKFMLEEVLRQQIDKDSGTRDFRLRPDMVKLASDLMVECGLLKHEVKYEQLVDL